MKASTAARLAVRRAAERLTGDGAALRRCRPGFEEEGLGGAREGDRLSALLSYSGHTSVPSVARYARVSPKALGRWQQQRDPATRRR
jgi:hypothetical protein